MTIGIIVDSARSAISQFRGEIELFRASVFTKLATLEQNKYIVAMSTDPRWNAARDPRFFDGRMLIDIQTWDWNLRVAVIEPTAETKSQRQDGLDYRRNFEIRGRVRAPSVLSGKIIAISLQPFGPSIVFGPKGAKEVGRLSVGIPDQEPDFSATLMLPEAAIPSTATSLASVWKHLHIWTVDETDEGAGISAFSFSAAIHANLREWANAD